MQQDPNYLTELQQTVLAFESRGTWRFQGAKESAIRDELGLSLTRYYAILDAAIDKWDAAPQYPHLVNRLRRLRRQRAEQRSAS
ncbi:MAG TPA: DUF3263 domain-containing protein [Aeromicrobium sp.]|nr:DUF3263 domain-containing protein [Aeromicrobium sp.]HKY57643.1 DUF3263 domain-containing protein [Aeromicrobium sp.]